ncbi:MAG TPA: hypothetical protein VHM64_13225, partial [Candidatus Binatia bacterium]|nr:hypothetical protein [Candidatus Binatia bacterium]
MDERMGAQTSSRSGTSIPCWAFSAASITQHLVDFFIVKAEFSATPHAGGNRSKKRISKLLLVCANLV